MICYFTGTGNSYDVASRLAAGLGDELVSLNEGIKSGENRAYASTKPFIFVAPVYAGRIPAIVSEFIRTAKFTGPKEVYFIVTCAGMPDHSVDHIQELCHEKGWILQGFDWVTMPVNYILMFPTPSQKSIDKTIAASEKKSFELIQQIKSGKPFFHHYFFGKLMSGPINRGFYQYSVSAKGFYVNSSKCLHCATCVKVCPLNNIKLVNGLPSWGDKCTHCMGCISLCPAGAIEFKNKTEHKRRYRNSSYSVK